MTAMLLFPRFKAWDHNNHFLRGGLVYTYEPGTTTEKTTYSDKALSTANANPVVLDTVGEADIHFNGSVKMVLKDANGSLLNTVDDLDGFGPSDYIFFPDATQPDQGAATAGGNLTVKDFVDARGLNAGTIYFQHNYESTLTYYTFQTSETIPSNILCRFDNGAQLTDDANNASLIMGGLIDVPHGQHIFEFVNGTGKVTIRNQPIKVDWFSQDPVTAFGAIDQDNAVVEFNPYASYTASESITLTNEYVTINGNKATITTTADIDLLDINVDALADGTEFAGYIYVNDLALVCTHATPTGSGILAMDMVGTTITKCRVAGFQNGIRAASRDNLTIDDCYLVNNVYGIYFPAFYTVSTNQSPRIYNTRFVKSTDGQYGIVFDAASSNASIRDCSFEGDLDYGIYTVTGQSSPAHAVFSMLIDGCRWESFVAGDFLIYIDNTNTVTAYGINITNNQLAGPLATAIHAEGVENLNVRGNYFQQTGSGVVVEFDADCKYPSVVDNAMTPAGRGTLDWSTAEDCFERWQGVQEWNHSGAVQGRMKRLYVDSSQHVTSGTSLTTLATYTMPADTMFTNAGVHIHACGSISIGGSPANKLLTLNIGTSAIPILNANLSIAWWNVDVSWVNRTANSQIYRITASYTQFASTSLVTTLVTTDAEDTTGNLVISFAGTCSHADDSITQELMQVTLT